jgi:hypothetical protein
MIDKQFASFIHDFVKQYKTDVFSNISKCKSLILDHAKGEYKKEIRLLLQSLELGSYTDITNSNDLYITRISLIKKLQTGYFISEDIAASMIDLLLSVIRGYKTENKTTLEEKKESIDSINQIWQVNRHDYETEAKAERLYQIALKNMFADIANNFTLTIDKLLKAIKLCPNDRRFHYFLSYCFYKVNDAESLLNETHILRKLGYDKNISSIIESDIKSSKQGKIALRMYNAFRRGGEAQVEVAQVSLYKQHKISYSESIRLYNQYKNFVDWSLTFDKAISS